MPTNDDHPAESNGFHPETNLERDLEGLVRPLLAEFARDAGVRAGCPGIAERERFGTVEIPEQPLEMGRFVEEILRPLVEGSSQTASPRCLGNMIAPVPAFLLPLAQVVARLNQNLVKTDSSPIATLCERQTLALLHRLTFAEEPAFYQAHAQNARTCLGSMASGGSLANLSALWCARKNRGKRGGVVLASQLRHYSIDKAADLLGLDPVVSVAVDATYRLCPSDLAAQMRAHAGNVVAVVGVAGTTVTGAIDPLEVIAEQAREYGTWFHVDAAWGGGLLLSPTLRHRLAGIASADSVVLDAHKQFYLPVGLSALLFRDPEAAAAIQYEAGYMLRDGSEDLGRWSLEGSRPWMSLLLYCALHLLGHSGYAARIEQSLARAELLADLIRERPGFELLLDPQTPQVVYRLVPEPGAAALTDWLNIEVQEHQRRHGVGYVSRSTLPVRPGISGTVILRAMLTNPATSRADLEAILDEQADLARWYLTKKAGHTNGKASSEARSAKSAT